MPDSFLMTNNTSENRWDLDCTVDGVGTGRVRLNTAGTFIDKNIQVSVTAPSAVLWSEGTVTTAPTVTPIGTTNMNTAQSGTYYFTVNANVTDGTVQTKYKATTAGFTQIVSPTNGSTVTVTPTNAGSQTIYIPTAIGTLNLTSGAGSCLYDSTNSSNVTVSDSNTSGIAITFKGSGNFSATSTITTAGYIPTSTITQPGASYEQSLTKYITGVKITAPSSGTRSFTLTVPNGNTTDFIDFLISVDSTGNVTVEGP